MLQNIFSVKNEYDEQYKYKILTIFGLKKILYKKKIIKIDCLDYIETHYKYAMNNTLDLQKFSGYENTIWQLWLQGEEEMPEIVKIATDSIKKYNPDKNIIVLNMNNLGKYISLPDYIIEKYQKGIITNAQFSDIIRLFLLYQYGGIWIDATVYQTGEIPEEIINSDFFVFKNLCGLILRKNMDKEQFKLLTNYCKMKALLSSSWFIKAQNNSPIIENILKIILEYWKHENKLINYFLFHYIFTFVVINNNQCFEEYYDIPQYTNIDVHLLQKHFYNEYNESDFQKIISLSNIHKLTYKFKQDIKNDSIVYYILTQIPEILDSVGGGGGIDEIIKTYFFYIKRIFAN